MNKKIDNLKDLQYYTDLEFLSCTLLEAINKKPSKQLSRMAEAVNNIHLYVVNMQIERRMYNKSMSEYRSNKNRAIERARRSEKKIIELQEELKKFNIFNK